MLPVKEKVEVIKTDALLEAAKDGPYYAAIKMVVDECVKGTKDRTLLRTRELQLNALPTRGYHEILRICEKEAYFTWGISITDIAQKPSVTEEFLSIKDAVAYLETAYKAADVSINEFFSWYLIDAQMDDAEVIIRALRVGNT